jgi:hypothetical protein
MAPTANSQFSGSGLNALLTPKDSVRLLVDHQAFQFAPRGDRRGLG